MSIKIQIKNQKAENVEEIELLESIFGVKMNEELVHQAMITQQANERQVLAHTKDRSEVRGGGKKPWKQKGTGRARAGSSRSPIWIGGGVTFGPTKDRNFKKKINKKMKRKAMEMVLSDKVRNENLIVLDDLKVDEYKTKVFNEILNNFEVKDDKEKSTKRSFLIINEKENEKAKCSARNLAGVEIINFDNINIVDLLKYRKLVLTKDIIKKIEERYK